MVSAVIARYPCLAIRDFNWDVDYTHMRMTPLSWRNFQYVLLAMGIFTAWSGIPAQSTSVSVDLCTVAANPQKYDGRLVKISAQYESDGMEREGLSDRSCREAGMELLFSPKTQGTEKLHAALRSGSPGTIDKTVRGIFTGVFHWKPSNHPPRSLDVQRIEQVEVQPN